MQKKLFALCLLISLNSLADRIEILEAKIHCEDNNCRKIFCCDKSNIEKFRTGYTRHNDFDTDLTVSLKDKCESNNKSSCEFSLNPEDYGGDELDSSYIMHVKYRCLDEEGGVIQLSNKPVYYRNKDYNTFHDTVSKSRKGHINCIRYPKNNYTGDYCARSTTCKTCSKWGCGLISTGVIIFAIVEAVSYFG